MLAVGRSVCDVRCVARVWATCAALLVTIGAMATMPSDARGSREATEQERAELLKAINASMSAECYLISVSTVDPAATWASVSYDIECIEAQEYLWGFVRVLRRGPSGWVVVATGRDLIDATDYIGNDVTLCPSKIPGRIGEDLRGSGTIDGELCLGRSRRVYAVRGNWFVVRPRRLSQGAHGTYEKLRWRHWGTRRAVARGELRYADAQDAFTAPVRITLSRRGQCGTRRTYLRISMRFVHSADARRYGTLDGARNMICPYARPNTAVSAPVERRSYRN